MSLLYQCQPETPMNAGPCGHAVREWLETQSRVIAYWRELLLAEGGEDQLIAALDDHAHFLQSAIMQSSDTRVCN